MSKIVVDTEQLIRDELKEAIELNLSESGYQIETDQKLIDALMTVLEYYSIPTEFDNYRADITSRRLKLEGTKRG